jgi:LuxR family maltose regulon positive regulatory protein
VSGLPHAGEILETLYARNLFLTEIDAADHFRWYRFHPLLRQRLLEHFLALDATERAAINRNACDWFSAHGYNDEAVRHAIYAGDAERAADLVESCARELIFSGMFRRLIGWAGSLPAESTARRLDLQLALGWAQIFSTRPEVTLRPAESKR